MRVLNVGGGTKAIPIPPFFAGWEHVLLDIDPKGGADIVADARDLSSIPEHSFDAVYCSHNLEHYRRHEVESVLRGFARVLKDTGFVHIRVPNAGRVMQQLVEKKADIEDVAYVAPCGPIMFHDILMGYGKEIAASGNDFFAHKTAFTPQLLGRVLQAAGFSQILIYIRDDIWEVESYAFVAGTPGIKYAV